MDNYSRSGKHPDGQSSLSLYLADGSLHRFSNKSANADDTRTAAPEVVGMDCAALPDGSLVQLVKDPHDPAALCLLRWKDGKATVERRIELGNKILVPPEIDPALVKALQLPNGIKSCGELQELLGKIESPLAEVVDLPDESIHLISKFILSTWFLDRLPVAPYLWIVGPPGSGKTTLLRFLQTACYHALLVGDLTAASLYQLPSLVKPTLLIDEADFSNSRMSLDIQRLLRTGNTPGTPAVRNGRLFQTFGAKAIASRHLPDDAALTSRAIIVRMPPARRKWPRIDSEWLDRLANELQAKLLMYLVLHYLEVGTSPDFSLKVEHLTPRMGDIASALAAPLLSHPELEGDLIRALEQQDQETRLERFDQREWLVVEELFRVCHQGKRNAMGRHPVCEVLVGGVAGGINNRLKFRGDSRRFTARAVGATLHALGIPRGKLGSLGRGIELTHTVRQNIHQLARDYGITRRDLLSDGHKTERGGMPCELCIEYNVTGGLKFVELPQRKLPARPRRRSRRLLVKAKQDSAGPAPIVSETSA